jgi:hypothetical protein
VVLNVLAVRGHSSFDPINASQPTQSSRMLSQHMYDNTGQEYNVSRILTREATLDLEAYQGYSPVFISYVVALFTFPVMNLPCIVPRLPWRMA